MRFRLSLQSTLLCLALITSAAFLRLTFLSSLTRDINSLNFGGDPCHHYNIAWNIARGNGPVTDFIFSYWFRHPALPALTDIYPPGVHYVLAFFLRILGEDYGSARLACLIFGSIAACPVYFMARHFLGRGLSFTAAAIVVLNAVHLEHSTVVMTPVIASFFVWLAVLAFLRLKGAYGWKGALAGWAHLCMSAVPPLILAFLVSESIQWRIERFPVRELFRRAIATGLGLGVVLAPWAYKTYSYFGKVFYTNFKFYPITDSWVPMNWQTTPPSWAGFVAQSGGLWKVAHLYLVQFGRGLAQVYCQSLPMWSPNRLWFIVANLIVLLLGCVQLFRKGFSKAVFLLTFLFAFLLMLSIGATANGGILFTRHVIVFVPFIAIIWALGAEFAVDYVKAIAVKARPGLAVYVAGSGRIALGAAVALLAAATFSWSGKFLFWKEYDLAGKGPTPFTELYAFHAFWTRQDPGLGGAAQWIESNTPANAVFMYGSTPQDFWGTTHRRVVIDPVYAGGNPLRAAEEANFYKVDFLVLDSRNVIYDRHPMPTNLAEAYPGLILTPVWKNDAGSFAIYRIGNAYEPRAP